MKTLSVAALVILSLGVSAQEKDLVTILNDQVAAFNEGNADQLATNVSDDFKWFSLTADTLLVEVRGKENFRQSMTAYLSSGRKTVSVIEEYFVEGNRISFRELVSYQSKDGKTVTASAMGIYQIENGKISRAWYFAD